MSNAVLTFVLAIAGTLIFALSALLWWFIRDRMKQRGKKEDLLDKRLASGSETMQRMTSRIEQMQNNQVEQFAKVVPQEIFEKYCVAHKEDHIVLDRRVEQLHQGQAAVQNEVRAFGAKLEAGIDTMTGLLSKIVTIPTDPGDVED